jgi:hypothetical protein
MCFSRYCWLLLLGIITTHLQAATTGPDFATSTELQVTPDKCISLQQGRTCYSKVTASWRSQTPLDLCLFMHDQQLHCWQQHSSGTLVFEFAAEQSTLLQLRQQQQVVQQVLIEVNWVHKASKTKRHWRLF